MGLVVLEGLIILLLVLTGFRKAVFEAMPRQLKTAISVGIGLFIAFIGIVDAGFVRRPAAAGGPPVELGVGGNLRGWPVLVFVVGLLLIITLLRAEGEGRHPDRHPRRDRPGDHRRGDRRRRRPDRGQPGGWGLSVPKLPDDWFSKPDLDTDRRVQPVRRRSRRSAWCPRCC